MASTENLSGRTGTVDLHDGEKTAVTGDIPENTTFINTTNVQYKTNTQQLACGNINKRYVYIGSLYVFI